MQYLSIKLSKVLAVQNFLTSQKLQKFLRMLQVEHCRGLKEVELPLLTLQRLRKLYFLCYSDLKLVKINMGNEEKHGFSGGHISNSNFLNLVHVQIAGCHRLLNLTWLIYASSLEGLMVTGGNRMEEITGSGEGGDSEIQQQSLNIFSRLEKLRLQFLPNLKSISRWALPFPSLRDLRVWLPKSKEAAIEFQQCYQHFGKN